MSGRRIPGTVQVGSEALVSPGLGYGLPFPAETLPGSQGGARVDTSGFRGSARIHRTVPMRRGIRTPTSRRSHCQCLRDCAGGPGQQPGPEGGGRAAEGARIRWITYVDATMVACIESDHAPSRDDDSWSGMYPDITPTPSQHRRWAAGAEVLRTGEEN